MPQSCLWTLWPILTNMTARRNSSHLFRLQDQMSNLLPCRSQTNTALSCYSLSLTTGLFFGTSSHLRPEVKVNPYRDFDFGKGVASLQPDVSRNPRYGLSVCNAGYRGASSTTFLFVCFTRYHGYIRCQAIVISKIRKGIVKPS